jgi:peroxiredoxin Q/BCP
MAKKSTKKVTRKVVKKTTKKAAKKVVKKVTKKVAAKKAAPAKKVVKKITKKKSAAVIKTVSLKIGDMAPEFNLEDQNGKPVSLKDFRGKNVVVYFYPKAMTPGCTVQACSLRNSQSKLNDANIVVLGISADPVKKLKQFETKDKLNFTLLSDPDHKLIEAYGSWGMKKFMGREYMGILRQSFLIDQTGKIIHIMNKVDTKTHHDDVLKVFTNQK